MDLLEIMERSIKTEEIRNKPVTMGILESLLGSFVEELEKKDKQLEAITNDFQNQINGLIQNNLNLEKRLQGKEKSMTSALIRIRDKQEMRLNLDERDKKKVNFFCDYLEKIGEESSPSPKAFKVVKGLKSAVYAKKYRIWLDWADFLEDFYNWLHNLGYWAINPETGGERKHA